MAEIALESVTKTFGRAVAVRDLSLSVADGEFVVLLGPTGAGKTTTLRLIAGLETPDRGRIRIGDSDHARDTDGEAFVAVRRSRGAQHEDALVQRTTHQSRQQRIPRPREAQIDDPRTLLDGEGQRLGER